MTKPERKEEKKHDAWNRKHYGKKLAKMYRKLTKIERKFVLMRLRDSCDGHIPSIDSVLMDKYRKYSDKCWKTLPDKYFWRGDYYYM